jgi:hypothetical protein
MRRSVRQSMRVRAKRNTRIRPRQKINELITIWVSSILKAPLLNSLTPKVKLIQVISIATKYANKSFLSQLGVFFPHFSLGVEGWIWIGWVVSFGEFDCCFRFVVGGAGNELGSTLLTLILIPLKINTQFVCEFSCTLLHPTQVLLNHFLAQNSFFKTCSQICNLLLKLDILFDTIKSLSLREMHASHGGEKQCNEKNDQVCA